MLGAVALSLLPDFITGFPIAACRGRRTGHIERCRTGLPKSRHSLIASRFRGISRWHRRGL